MKTLKKICTWIWPAVVVIVILCAQASGEGDVQSGDEEKDGDYRSAYFVEDGLGGEGRVCDFVQVERFGDKFFCLIKQTSNLGEKVVICEYTSTSDTFKNCHEISPNLPPNSQLLSLVPTSMAVVSSTSKSLLLFSKQSTIPSSSMILYTYTLGNPEDSESLFQRVEEELPIDDGDDGPYFMNDKNIYFLSNFHTSGSSLVKIDKDTKSQSRIEFLPDRCRIKKFIAFDPENPYSLVISESNQDVEIIEISNRDSSYSIKDSPYSPFLTYHTLFTCPEISTCKLGDEITWVSYKDPTKSQPPTTIFLMLQYDHRNSTSPSLLFTSYVYFITLKITTDSSCTNDCLSKNKLVADCGNVLRTSTNAEVRDSRMDINGHMVYGVYFDVEYDKYVMFQYDISAAEFLEKMFEIENKYSIVHVYGGNIFTFGQYDSSCGIARVNVDEISKHQDFEEVSTNEQRKFTNLIPELSCSSIPDTLNQKLRNLDTIYEKSSPTPENINEDIDLSLEDKRELGIVSSEEADLELYCLGSYTCSFDDVNKSYPLNISQHQTSHGNYCMSFCYDRCELDIRYKLIPLRDNLPHGEAQLTEIAKIDEKTGKLNITNENLTLRLRSFVGRIEASIVGASACGLFHSTVVINETQLYENYEADIDYVDTYYILQGIILVLGILIALLAWKPLTSVFIVINQQQLIVLLMLIDIHIHPEVRNYIVRTNIALLDFEFAGYRLSHFFGLKSSLQPHEENKQVILRYFGYSSPSMLYTNKNLFLFVMMVILIQFIFYVLHLLLRFCQSIQLRKRKGERSQLNADNNNKKQKNRNDIDEDNFKSLAQNSEQSQNMESIASTIRRGRPITPSSNDIPPTSPTPSNPSSLSKASLLSFRKSNWKYTRLHLKVLQKSSYRILIEAYTGLLLTSWIDIRSNRGGWTHAVAYVVFGALCCMLIKDLACNSRARPVCTRGRKKREERARSEEGTGRLCDCRSRECECGEKEEIEDEDEEQKVLLEQNEGVVVRRMYQPMMLLRKFIFVMFIMELPASKLTVLWSLFVVQIFFCAVFLMIKTFKMLRFEWNVQFSSEVFFTFIILFFLTHSKAKDWKLDSENQTPKFMIIGFLIFNLAFIIVLQSLNIISLLWVRVKQLKTRLGIGRLNETVLEGSPETASNGGRTEDKYLRTQDSTGEMIRDPTSYFPHRDRLFKQSNEDSESNNPNQLDQSSSIEQTVSINEGRGENPMGPDRFETEGNLLAEVESKGCKTIDLHLKDASLLYDPQIKGKEGFKGKEMTDIQKKIMATDKTQFEENSNEEDKEDRHGQSLFIQENEESLEMQNMTQKAALTDREPINQHNSSIEHRLSSIQDTTQNTKIIPDDTSEPLSLSNVILCRSSQPPGYYLNKIQQRPNK
ncbi:unnamed protein product [Moneuplotes crassus]|uniref:TRP C-terminal domain-containing protein n=1 Tax=Euplotes crassus TaxID=5936 RepID=A0AAD1XT49_EUPCR|nr:unnamed protein product [Moneuplotes crassus]